MEDIVLIEESFLVVGRTEERERFLGKGRSEDVDERADEPGVDVRLPFLEVRSGLAVEGGQVVGLVGVFPDVVVLGYDELKSRVEVSSGLLDFGREMVLEGYFMLDVSDEVFEFHRGKKKVFAL